MNNLKSPDKGKSEKAYFEIKNYVLELKSSPNEPLSELKLAAQLGMSRTPVREALKRLENEGLLVSYGKRGTFINIPTKEEIKDILQVRIFLETAAMFFGDAAYSKDTTSMLFTFNRSGRRDAE